MPYPYTYQNPYMPQQLTYGTNPQLQTQYQQPMQMQQSYAQPPVKGMEWVEGEIGAKAFQMPQGWPANTPIPLWDSTDTVIYLKSVNQMGVPNPMTKIKYTIEEQQNQMLLPQGQSGSNTPASPDMSQYVTRQDFEQLRNEIHNMNHSGTNGQNGSESNQGNNRGGNR